MFCVSKLRSPLVAAMTSWNHGIIMPMQPMVISSNIRTLIVSYRPESKQKNESSKTGIKPSIPYRRYRMRTKLGGQEQMQYSPSLMSSSSSSSSTSIKKEPSLDIAKAMPLSHCDMDNSTLVTLATWGDHEARKEVLKRHIMVQDHVSYNEACQTYKKISKKNEEFMYLLSLPYQIGISMGLIGAAASIPLVFDLKTALWFNEVYVTTNVPPPEDLESCLEVGSWTWNWMEPPLGTISFLLLALQFSRAQFVNLGAKPYTEKVKHWRGERLARAFPHYDANILIAYSESRPLYK